MDLLNQVSCDHRVGNPVNNYVLTTCPRCLGKGVYGGVVFGNNGQLVLVQGSPMLAQQLQKILTENARPSGYGFDYSLLQGVIDPSKLSAIKSEIIRCISYLKYVQEQSKARGFVYAPSEELFGIKEISIGNSPTDPRAVNVSVVVSSVSGAQSNVTAVLRR